MPDFFQVRRSILIFFAGLALTGGGMPAQAPVAAPQPPATIYLIRHAEKLTDKRPDLAPDGYVRASLIPKLFMLSEGDSRVPLPRPDFLFATARSKNSNRPVETITPLSDALNEPVSHDVLDDDFADLAKLLLSGRFAGKVALVAWHHGKLPEFAMALGATPPYAKWPDTQFDRIWRIDYKNGKATLTDLPMLLMPGDSK
jgi:hypothetical protein